MTTKLNRRQAIGAGFAVAAVGLGGIGLWRARPARFAFRDMAGVDGFRWLSAGAVSAGGADPFAGLGAGAARPAPISDSALCGALFGPGVGGAVPVASFSDYACPYCRVLTALLADHEAAGRVRMTWHELPLLGPVSVEAARAALAAGRQGAYLAFHSRLMRARFQPDRAYATALAESIGLDTGQFEEDLESDWVSRKLVSTASVARRFGFAATPALVVGNTAVLGAIGPRDLRALIDLEAGRTGRCRP